MVDKPVDILNLKSTIPFFEDYRELLQKYSVAAEKHQKEVTVKLRNVEPLTARALKAFRYKAAEVERLEEGLRMIDDITLSVMQCNDSIRSVVNACQRLCDILPDDMKMGDSLSILVNIKHDIRESTRARKREKSQFPAEAIRVRRGQAWQRALGNKLGIMPTHFDKYMEHVQRRKAEMENSGSTNAVEFASYVKLIEVDVPRTFSSLDVVQFKYNGHLSETGEEITVTHFRKELIEVLEAYVTSLYFQFLTIVGLLYFDQQSAMYGCDLFY